MWLNLLIILGTCVAVAAIGFSVYWIIINIRKNLRSNQSNSLEGKRQIPLTDTEDIEDPSLEQPLSEVAYAPDTPGGTDAEAEDGDWLNTGVPEASASTLKKKDDDWLNAGVEEVPTDVYKQQNDDWLNAENNQPLETGDESWLNHAITNRPEIQIRQDGSILNITATASKKRDLKSEQTVIKLKIRIPSQDLARKGEGPCDIEITTDDSLPPYQSLQDITTVQPLEKQVTESHVLMDEIFVRSVESPVLTSSQLIDDITVQPLEKQVTESHVLMDEIIVRPVESPVLASPQLMDQISIRPVEKQVAESHILMDEIFVRPVESPVLVSPQLMDQISIRPVEKQVSESHALMDEISIKPSPGPVDVEYELLDNLITKSAIYLTKKAKPSSDTVLTNPVKALVAKSEPVKTVSFNEIAEVLNEKRDFNQPKIPSVAIELRSAQFLTRSGEGTDNLLSQFKTLYKKARLPGAMIKALATLRIRDNNEFYIQDTNLKNVDTLTQEPQIRGFTFKVLHTATEVEELIDGGYNLVVNFSAIKRGLKKGMVAFLALVHGELACMGWACMTEKSKATFRGYPYFDDLDGQACIVGNWTNPKFRDSSISSYVTNKRQQLLKEKGFTFERSIVEESMVKDLCSLKEKKRFELTYRHRTYTNLSFPGILGVELWKEHLLDGTDNKPPYEMIILTFLGLPCPPMVAHLNDQSNSNYRAFASLSNSL
jgi:hypothetical protein